MTLDRFGLGCWAYGLAAPGSEEERSAAAVVREAYRRGVRHFDTAHGYGDGQSEAIVGAALAGLGDAEIATKSGLLPAQETRNAVERSRQRLQRDTIDLFYIHWPKRGVDARPMLAELEQARAAGLIRRIGVSNFSRKDLQRAAEVARVDVHQVGYNLLWRYPEREVLPYCRERDIAVFSYSSLAQGLLTGKMPRRPAFAATDPRPNTVYYDAEVWPHIYAAVERMKEIAAAAGQPLHHLALQWLVESATVARVLVGARSIEQLHDNLAAFEQPAAVDARAQLQQISDDVHTHIPDVGNMFMYYP